MSLPWLALLSALTMLVGLVLGALSLPRRSVGPASAYSRRILAFVGTGLFLPSYLGLFLWLNETVAGWPEAYGTSCSGRGCTIDYLVASPGLLGGGWREHFLFAILWFMPIVLAATLALLAMRALCGRRVAS